MSVLHKILTFVLLCFVFVGQPFAQEAPPEELEIIQAASEELSPDPAKVIVNRNDAIKSLPLMDQVMQRVKMRQPSVTPAEINSLFFTVDELSLVRQARAGLITSLYGEDENGEGDESDAEEVLQVEPIVREPGPRNVRLGGILYLSKMDWAVWINGEEVRPNAIPSRLLDIRVYKDHIELEWFDTQTNQIYPIRLRPNQTFNLDSRLFLPG